LPEPISAGETPDQADGGARGRAWVRANRVEKTASEQGCGRAVCATVMVGVSVRAGSPVLVAGLDQTAQPSRCELPDSCAAATPSSVVTDMLEVEWNHIASVIGSPKPPARSRRRSSRALARRRPGDRDMGRKVCGGFAGG